MLGGVGVSWLGIVAVSAGGVVQVKRQEEQDEACVVRYGIAAVRRVAVEVEKA